MYKIIRIVDMSFIVPEKYYSLNDAMELCMHWNSLAKITSNVHYSYAVVPAIFNTGEKS